MTTEDTGQISVAELLARNGRNGGVNATEGGRRRRGVAGGISVAELTGEIPVVRDEPQKSEQQAEPAKREPKQLESESTNSGPANSGSTKPESTKPEPKPQAAPDTAGEQSDDADSQPPTAAWPTLGPDAGKPPEQPEPTEAAEAVSSDARTVRQQPRPTAWSSQSEPALLAGSPTSSDLIGRSDETPEESTDALGTRPVVGTPSVHRSWMNKKSDPDSAAVVDRPSNPDAGEHDTEPAVPPKRKHSGLRQWLVLIAQAVVAVVVGALLFKGFERLWDMLPWVALVLALLVILGLVALVRILRKTDDLLSIVIAIVVGVFVTMGPLVFLLSTS